MQNEEDIHEEKKAGGWSFCCCRKCKKEVTEPLSYLYAFDFDHTIVDQNSDSAIMECIHDPIPQDLQRLFDGTNWEQYMESVFKFVSDEGGSYEIIASKICELEPTDGMPLLLQRISVSRELNQNSKLIIISDANTFFIETYLNSMKPPVLPDAMITNKADKTEEGYLKLTPYEQQTDCPLCPRNLCKGMNLLKYITKQGPFEQVFYVGDGGNDLCPAMALGESDTVFVRRDFALEKILQNGIWKGKVVNIRAKIVYWSTAQDIEQEMRF